MIRRRYSFGMLLLLTLVAGVSYWAGHSSLLETPSGNSSNNPCNVRYEPELNQPTIKRPKLYLPKIAKLKRGYVRVKRVVDGDTLVVVRSGKDVKVRLIGIDTPEVGRYEIVESGPGWRSTMWVYDLLKANPQVKLTYDKERLDKYNRTLAYCWLIGGKMLNMEVLAQGYGLPLRIPPNTRHADKFSNAAKNADRERLGLWKG
ncbi:MAG: thermonuclease family protein [Planctomycetes bacterium]|nr:thermonuclease family protein [Planctomycetota bacterium]